MSDVHQRKSLVNFLTISNGEVPAPDPAQSCIIRCKLSTDGVDGDAEAQRQALNLPWQPSPRPGGEG